MEHWIGDLDSLPVDDTAPNSSAPGRPFPLHHFGAEPNAGGAHSQTVRSGWGIPTRRPHAADAEGAEESHSIASPKRFPVWSDSVEADANLCEAPNAMLYAPEMSPNSRRVKKWNLLRHAAPNVLHGEAEARYFCALNLFFHYDPPALRLDRQSEGRQTVCSAHSNPSTSDVWGQKRGSLIGSAFPSGWSVGLDANSDTSLGPPHCGRSLCEQMESKAMGESFSSYQSDMRSVRGKEGNASQQEKPRRSKLEDPSVFTSLRDTKEYMERRSTSASAQASIGNEDILPSTASDTKDEETLQIKRGTKTVRFVHGDTKN